MPQTAMLTPGLDLIQKPRAPSRRTGTARRKAPFAALHGVPLLAIADLAAGLAAPRLASLIAGPAPTLAQGLGNWIGFATATVVAMLLCGLYGIAPARAPLDHAWPILRALIAAHAALLLRFALIRAAPATPPLAGSIGWAATGFGLAAILVLGERLAIAAWWRRDGPRGTAALVTTGPCDRSLRDRLDRLAGYRLGYLFAWGTPQAAGLRLIADVATFEAMIRAGRIDDIVVFTRRTDDEAARAKIDALLARLADQPVRVRLAFDAVAEIGAGGVATGQSLRMVTVLDRPIPPLATLYKRLADLVLGSLLLALLAPIMALIAIALRATGPVLFRQRRIGLDGTPFTVLKFRTMRAAASKGAILQARRGDPRVTRLGVMLRRLSLDELPQIFNVLRGEMSLVGPRPHAPQTSTGSFTFEAAIAFYGVRHRVKPGLTGLAQVRGLRGPTERPEMIAARVAADLDYIEHWSPWLDLAILLRTVPAVLGGRNAY
ncbi:exopolysaccharide biosynthesis polyprenyl glycosylphosphotransferase [Acidiphilium sp. AL]|uniref:exopolysaccharide biosynthesis polyprenyl glycosylphosphotransferase n=1 Tax=Acidiphilium sp. AL TaxID=2871704 RepID=UPI0021CB75F1|nr:exopolysaccharide biosynthesis polyprenyl glycosylphosphotransferase [Acidiphilium sp. AL]